MTLAFGHNVYCDVGEFNQSPLVVFAADHHGWVLLLCSGRIKCVFEVDCDFVAVAIGVGSGYDRPAADVRHHRAEVMNV